MRADDYERLRSLVRRSPAFAGMRVVVHDDRVEILAPDELDIGLGPVADAVAGAPLDEWPARVDACLERILGAVTGGSPELDGPTEQLLDRVYARVRPVAGTPVEWMTYAQQVAPGLLMVLALDHPDHLTLLNDDHVRQHGVDRLLAAGMDNLCHRLPDRYAECDEVYVLTGADHVGSAVLVISWVVAAVTGRPDHPHGVLVAMPDHDTLIFHVLRDGAGARYAVREMAELADRAHRDASNPITREVYWWRDGADFLEPVAHAGGATGAIGDDLVTTYPRDFATLLDELDQVHG